MIKGKSVEPFTCLQHQGLIVIDCSQIDRLLQESWNPIFAKYPEGENKAVEYHAAFSLAPGALIIPCLALLLTIFIMFCVKSLKIIPHPVWMDGGRMNLKIYLIVFYRHFSIFSTFVKK